jgi:hypothetical protein
MKTYKLIKTYPFSQPLGFIISNDEDRLIYRDEMESLSEYPEFWQEVKEPIFSTYDGVEVFDENIILFVVFDGFYHCSMIRFKDLGCFQKERKVFSTIEASEKWINENKPVFSKKIIRDAIEKSLKFPIYSGESTISYHIINEIILKKELGL